MANIYQGMKASSVVDSFLTWLEDAKDDQEKAWTTVETEDKRVQDFLHEMEFEKDRKKRSLIATRLHYSRVKRRAAKDRAEELKPIRDFVSDVSNKGYLKRLKKLQCDMKAAEDRHAGERIYKPRVSEVDKGQ